MNLIAEWISVALMIGLIGFVFRSTSTLRKVHTDDCKDIREEAIKQAEHMREAAAKQAEHMREIAIKQIERLVKLETKMDIYLDHEGFSIQKIDRAINEHMEELKQNDRPRVGCIDIKALYKDKCDVT